MLNFALPIVASVFICCAAISASAAPVSLLVDGKPALTLQAPAGSKVTSSNAYVNIRTTNMSLHVWAVANAAVPQDGISRVPVLIKTEFVKFKPTATNDITIAGAPAKHIIGSGEEADDGDPGHAEVVLFVAGGRVFAGCVHGEFDDASHSRAPMLAVLQTVHAPR